MDVLNHHRDSIKLNKSQWFRKKWMNAVVGGKKPTQLNSEDFDKLYIPHTWSELRMLIVLFFFTEILFRYMICT